MAASADVGSPVPQAMPLPGYQPHVGYPAPQLGVPSQSPMAPPQQMTPSMPQWQGPYFDAACGRYYYFDPFSQRSEWAQMPAVPQYGAGPPAPGQYPGIPFGATPPTAAYAAAYPGAYYAAAPFFGPAIPPHTSSVTGSTSAGATTRPPDIAPDGRQECADFKRGKCDRGASCKYAHVDPKEDCQDFKRGRCTRGATCKFKHVGEVRARSRSR
eukprot:TRINITY_DN74530_c0_g1_i1.p1 TRINITY_DN74530_c0_g1~~TRINITY_DN74530_c0_g1_i1.p1  ORF type:complete len:237 (-),score=15.71 TRINITY_DN74530_c0_g1_i1:170-808(-)